MPEPTLYASILEAKIQIDSHESDLYFPVTEQTTAILAKFPTSAKNATTFISQIAPHVRWYDVPFAYLPFWESKQRKA